MIVYHFLYQFVPFTMSYLMLRWLNTNLNCFYTQKVLCDDFLNVHGEFSGMQIYDGSIHLI